MAKKYELLILEMSYEMDTIIKKKEASNRKLTY